jgi:hypothetical protein
MPASTFASPLERYLVLETAMPRGDIQKTTVCTSIVYGINRHSTASYLIENEGLILSHGLQTLETNLLHVYSLYN